MAANSDVDKLRKLTIGKIENVYSSLLNPSLAFDAESVLDDIQQIVEAVHCLDSVARLPKDIYSDIVAGKKIIAKVPTSSSTLSASKAWEGFNKLE